MVESGSGSGIGNKAIIISAKQQSHTEEYGVVHGSSNHGVLHEELNRRNRTTTRMNIKVIVQVAYMSAFKV